jgi:hypothetical protein
MRIGRLYSQTPPPNTASPGRGQWNLGNAYRYVSEAYGGYHLALTPGGGAVTNPGCYLALLPLVNGATAFSGAPYFTANPGDPFRAWDASLTFDFLPTQFSAFRFEYHHRASNVPYFSGPGGVTPPGGNTGLLGSFVQGFAPDLRKFERRFTLGFLFKL